MSKLKRILYAEDDEKDIVLTMNAFKENNLVNEIIIVNNGQQVLDYLYYQEEFKNRKKGDPAVILLDLKMPKVNGLEVLRKIKADKNLKKIPVVILTSSREEKDLVESYELGVNAYVVKPVDFEEFTEAVKQTGLFWALINQSPSCSL